LRIGHAEEIAFLLQTRIINGGISLISFTPTVLPRSRDCGRSTIETARVILNRAGAWLGNPELSLIASVSTALKPDQ
jgi:hypothetical protein